MNGIHLILLSIPAIFLIWMVIEFNRFIIMRNRCINQLSQIDVELGRRHKLIPLLVNIVEGYLEHEKDTLQHLTRSRSVAISHSGIRDKALAENRLGSSLKTLFAVTEGYPDLMANEQFLELHDSLVETENRIRFARQFYNDVVMRYNTLISTAPNLLAAKILGFSERPFFSDKA